ncbi:MAG TPA: hypothetical protein VFQ91_18850 [Bryobacteraceae bacterium]|nr:hypothetical protein [Bryobacteraceae bacterium]
MRVLDIRRGDSVQRIVTYLTEAEVERLRGLPPEGVIGVLHERQTLQVNAVFREFLHAAIAQCAPRDPAMRELAAVQGDGRMVYVDSRVPESIQPVPEEDVLGWFLVRAGHIVEGSYLPNPGHRMQGTHGLSAAIAAMRPAMAAELLRRETS